MWKPGGTGRPAAAMRASDAPLPPTRSSVAWGLSRWRMNGLAGGEFIFGFAPIARGLENATTASQSSFGEALTGQIISDFAAPWFRRGGNVDGWDPRTNDLIGLRLTGTHPDPEWSFSARSALSNGGMGNARHPTQSVLRFFSWCSSALISASPLLRGEIAARTKLFLRDALAQTGNRRCSDSAAPTLGTCFGTCFGTCYRASPLE